MIKKTEIKIALRNMRHAQKIYRQDKTYKLKHNESPRLRGLVIRTNVLYYKKKLNECGNDYSKIFDQLNILIGKNNCNMLPSGKLPLPQAKNFKDFFFDKLIK